jgi:hypothetical protein
MELVEWIRNLTPAQAFLYALPFVVAAVGLAAEWWRRWYSRHGGRRR